MKKTFRKIVMPIFGNRKKKFEKLNSTSSVLVYDVPLIYETNSESNYDLILLTNCRLNLQKKVLKSKYQMYF